MNSTSRTRIAWVDTVKFFCIFAVMAEHSLSVTDNMDAFIVPFFLNGFSFAAGYVYVHREGFGTMMKKKVRQLLIPCYFFSFFIIISSQILTFGERENFLRAVLLSFLQIRNYGDQMWYIAALFVCFIPFYFFIGAYEKTEKNSASSCRFLLAALALSMLSLAFSSFAPKDMFPWSVPENPEIPVALPWHLQYVFQAMLFMFLGYLFKNGIEERFDRLNNPLTALLLFGAYILSVFCPTIFDFRFTPLGTYLVSYPRALLGVASVVAFSKLLPSNRYFSFLGQSTIAYYGLHGKVFAVINVLARRIIGYERWDAVLYGSELTRICCSVLMAFAASLLLIIPIMLINRFLPFAVGKKRRTNA